MKNFSVDWRTEIATQVCTLVRDERVMARFRAMGLEFLDEKRRDEGSLAAWEQRRKEFCQRGLRTLDDFKARTTEMERLGNNREAIEKTRPPEDAARTLVYDYYQDHLSYEDAQGLGDLNAAHMLVGFCVWVPRELSLASSPELTVPDVLARFLGGMDLHSSAFGRFIEPGIAGWPEKYSTLAVFHDAVFPERAPIDCNWESHRNAIFDMPDETEVSIREWLADIEADLITHIKTEEKSASKFEIRSETDDALDSPKQGALVATMSPDWLKRIALSVHQHTFVEINTNQYREKIRSWAERVSPGWKTPAFRAFLLREAPDRTDAELDEQLLLIRNDLGRIVVDRKSLGIGLAFDRAVPSDQKFTTMAALHEKYCDCLGFGVEFWLPTPGEFRNPVLTKCDEDWDTLTESFFFKAMVEDASALTNDDRAALEEMHAFVSSDLEKCQEVITPQMKPIPSIETDLPARHSADFRSVCWFGKDHSFTPNQATVVSLLWHAWENGTPEVSDAYLLTKAESDCKRLADVFRIKREKKYHPAWDSMIIAGRTKGTRRLNSSEASKSDSKPT